MLEDIGNTWIKTPFYNTKIIYIFIFNGMDCLIDLLCNVLLQ